MKNSTKRNVDKLNRLLATELGSPKPGINGKYAWIWSDSKQLQIGMKVGTETVLDEKTGIYKVVPKYDWRPILPNHPHYKRLWVMCYTDQGISENQWWQIFGTELPQVTYWKPVQCDPMMNSVAGRETKRENLIQYVTAAQGHEPDEHLTWKFIHAVREARQIQNMVDHIAIMEKQEKEKHQNLVDYYKSYALPSFLKQGGKKNHAFMPATVTKDGKIIR